LGDSFLGEFPFKDYPVGSVPVFLKVGKIQPYKSTQAKGAALRFSFASFLFEKDFST
jgi:hypothetical protein